ncbi:uncharacterized protein LOC131641331 [Vicia villosa]|uniref:uncharacterized protein LOC131641330 n=1 Tax=Vicia villosa TaxID=3911 RepID=UPI00273A8A93|nr:uncharacterized protein LOC131641330 [Vicia villosa]XP_058767618.1 uncharacterized protein LOC131641331 [Vicia villosa]
MPKLVEGGEDGSCRASRYFSGSYMDCAAYVGWNYFLKCGITVFFGLSWVPQWLFGSSRFTGTELVLSVGFLMVKWMCTGTGFVSHAAVIEMGGMVLEDMVCDLDVQVNRLMQESCRHLLWNGILLWLDVWITVSSFPNFLLGLFCCCDE